MSPEELFARGVWNSIPDEEDCSWVQRAADMPGDNGPLGDYGPIVKEMLEKGISPETIARFAKMVGYYAAGGVCYLMEDSYASYDGLPDDKEKISWQLHQIDPDTEKVITPILGVHTLLLMMDPSNRDLSPK